MVAESVSHDVSISSGHLEWLPVSTLQVDPRYQRELSELKVRKIVKSFDPDAFGVIVVSTRNNGERYVVDGQHRIAAVHKMGWSDQRVPCVVYHGLSLEEEAKVFYLPQTTRLYMTPAQRFKARLVAGEETATAIKRIVESHGFSVNVHTGGTPHPAEIDAIGALEHVYMASPDNLDRVLGIVVRSWGTDTYKVQAGVLLGLSRFIAKYKDMYDRARLLEVLRKVTPLHLTGNARDIRKAIGGNSNDSVGRSILRVYNKNLQVRRLPEWDAIRQGQVK